MCKDLLFGEAPQHLAKIADLDAASCSRVRLPAAVPLCARLFGFVQATLGDGHIVAQSSREQGLAQLREVLAPANFFGDRRRMTEVRRMHQFQVLFILCRRPRRDFVNPLANVPVIRPAKFREGIEEMIVPRHAGRRHKSSHRKCIHKRVVQFLILERIGRRNSAFSARRLFRSAT